MGLEPFWIRGCTSTGIMLLGWDWYVNFYFWRYHNRSHIEIRPSTDGIGTQKCILRFAFCMLH